MLIYKCALTCPDNNGQNPAQMIMVDNWADIDDNGVKAGSSLYKSQLLTFFRITRDF